VINDIHAARQFAVSSGVLFISC